MVKHRDPAFWTPRGRVPTPHFGPLELDTSNPLSAGLLAYWLLGFSETHLSTDGSTHRNWRSFDRENFAASDTGFAGSGVAKGVSSVGLAAVFNGSDSRFGSSDIYNAKFNHPNITFVAGITCTTLVQFGMIGCQWNETGNLRRWSLNINSVSGDLRADASANGTTIAATATTSTGEIAANRRHVVGIVANGTGNSDIGTGLQIFVDGTAKGSLASYSSDLASLNTNFMTGTSAQWGAAQRFFTGIMDFSAMWSRPLSLREMRQFMSDPFSLLRPRASQMAARKMVAISPGGSQQSAVSIIF
jgi:hypothetical protein